MAETAVIVNEFGEIGLDHLLVESATDDIVLLNSGCLCCTVRGDIADTLLNLFVGRASGKGAAFQPRRDRNHRPRRPGADPAHADLRPARRRALFARRRRDHGRRGQRRRHARPPARGGQAGRGRRPAVADQGRSRRARMAAALQARLAALNPSAPILPVAQGEVDPALLFNLGFYDPQTKSVDVQRWLRDEAFEAEHDHDHDDEQTSTSTATTSASAPFASPATSRSRGRRCRPGSMRWRRCAATTCCG